MDAHRIANDRDTRRIADGLDARRISDEKVIQNIGQTALMKNYITILVKAALSSENRTLVLSINSIILVRTHIRDVTHEFITR